MGETEDRIEAAEAEVERLRKALEEVNLGAVPRGDKAANTAPGVFKRTCSNCKYWTHPRDFVGECREPGGDTFTLTRNKDTCTQWALRQNVGRGCPTCNGTGRIEQGFCDGPCAQCNGRGWR